MTDTATDPATDPAADTVTDTVTQTATDTASETLSRTFAALADPTRRDILARLTEGDQTLSELAEPYRISVQAVSKHLRVLESAGLVERGRGTGRRPAHLLPHALDVGALWLEEHRRRAEERYRRLDTVLAEMATPDDSHSARGETR